MLISITSDFPGGGGGVRTPYPPPLDPHMCCGSQFVYREILRRNYRKVTTKWSFSYNSFVKLSLYNMTHL